MANQAQVTPGAIFPGEKVKFASPGMQLFMHMEDRYEIDFEKHCTKIGDGTLYLIEARPDYLAKVRFIATGSNMVIFQHDIHKWNQIAMKSQDGKTICYWIGAVSLRNVDQPKNRQFKAVFDFPEQANAFLADFNQAKKTASEITFAVLNRIVNRHR